MVAVMMMKMILIYYQMIKMMAMIMTQIMRMMMMITTMFPDKCRFGDWGEWGLCVKGNQQRIRKVIIVPSSSHHQHYHLIISIFISETKI